MKTFLKDNYKFLSFVLITGLLGSYCLGVYGYDSLSEAQLAQLEAQHATKSLIVLTTMFQYTFLYGLLLACLGILLSKKVNLWKEFKPEKSAIIATVIITIIGALILFPGDKLIFGHFSSWVNESYLIKPAVYNIIGGILVGGVIEEVMMRLFLMSLLTLVLYKVFCKNKEDIPVAILIIANVLSALLFTAGHLPATAIATTLTPLLILRCFLFNVGLGLAFGYLYRKHGIVYAMSAHGCSHLVADILMLMFI